MNVPYDSRCGDATCLGIRARDYVVVGKPRILLVAVASVSVGYFAGAGGSVRFTHLWFSVVLISAVAYGAAAFNQCSEWVEDRLMCRTVDRPVSSGRVTSREVILVGGLVSAVGIVGLWVWCTLLTALLALSVLVLYGIVYTPLKRVTFFGTIPGAISGALPPMLGWCASGNENLVPGLVLFTFLFGWQFPHFLAIATIYKKDYAVVGYRLLPLIGSETDLSGPIAAAYAIGTLPSVIWVERCGLVGSRGVLLLVVCGICYVLVSFRFWHSRSIRQSRIVLTVSLIFVCVAFVTVGLRCFLSLGS